MLIYEDLEHLTPYMHTADDVVGLSLNSPELLEANARLAAALALTLAGPLVPDSRRAFIRGDADADGRVQLNDAVFFLRFLFVAGPAPTCLDAADANDDGSLDVSDAVASLLALFGGVGPLPPPGLACGADPTADLLSCAEHLPCGGEPR